jgi:hypothetical protein
VASLTQTPPLRNRVAHHRVGGPPKRSAFDRLFTTEEPMSTITTHHCNRCGKVIVSGRTALAISCGPLRYSLGTDEVDLCEDDATAFSSWLRAREAEEALSPPLAAAS